jgi:hypothetical protein
VKHGSRIAASYSSTRYSMLARGELWFLGLLAQVLPLRFEPGMDRRTGCNVNIADEMFWTKEDVVHDPLRYDAHVDAPEEGMKSESKESLASDYSYG